MNIGERMMAAHRALSTHKDSSHQSGEENVTDLLTNLMHFCGQCDIDFDRCLITATLHHDAEIIGGKG